MNTIELDDYQIAKLQRIVTTGFNNGGGIFRIDNNTLAKIYFDNYFFCQEREENTDYLLSTNRIKNSSYPIKKIMSYDDYIGYTMPFIKNANTFREGLGKENLTTQRKLKILKDISVALKEFHERDIIFGDIHLDNYIYNDNGGYIIDLDDIRLPHNILKFMNLYNVRESTNSKFLANSKNIDTIKSYICCYSLLFSIDLEKIIRRYSLKEIIDVLYNNTNDLDLKQIFNFTLSNTTDSNIYFHELLETFNDIELIEDLKRKIKQ